MSVLATPGTARISSLRRRSRSSSSSQTSSAEHVERPGRDHEVVDLGQAGEPVGDGADVTVDADADHGHAPEPQHHRVGDGHDLGDADLDQPPHALAHRRLRQPHLLRELRVRPTAVVLERLDETLVDVVERDGSGRFGHRWRMTRRPPAPQAIRRSDRSPSRIRAPSGFPAAIPCVACRRVRAAGRLVPRAPALARRGGARRDRGVGAGTAPGGRRRGDDRRRVLRRHRRRRPGPTGSPGSSCSRPATKGAGRAPGTAAWSSPSSSTDRTRWSAATATPVGPCCGRRSPRTRSCATSWRTRRSRATGGSAVGSSSPTIRARCRRCGRRQASGSRPGSRCACSTAPELRSEIGSDAFAAGLLMERTAAVQPAKLHAALVARARAAGAGSAASHAGHAPRAAWPGVPGRDRARRHRRGRRPRGRERVRRRRAPGP